MILWPLFTSRYAAHLERENADLKSQLAQERQEVRRLTEALVPVLQRAGSVSFITKQGYTTSEAPAKAAHHITKAEDQQSA
jgi:hypothetical protein